MKIIICPCFFLTLSRVSVVHSIALRIRRKKLKAGDSGDDERDPEFQTGRLVGADLKDGVVQKPGGSYVVEFVGDTRRREVWTSEQVEWGIRLHENLGIRVAKEFGDEDFFGTVVDIDEDDDWYRIRYDDGDGEDFDDEQLRAGQAKYASLFPGDDQKKAKKKRAAKEGPPVNDGGDDDADLEEQDGGMRKRRCRAIPNYKEDDDDDESMMDLDEEGSANEKPSARRRSSSRPAKGDKKHPASKKQKKSAVDSDDDVFEMEDADDIESATDDEVDFEDDESDNKPKKKVKATTERGKKTKATATARGTTKTKGRSASSAATDDGRFDSDFQDKMKKDRGSFKPKNNPQQWPKDGDYVDPVGVDPTDGIVEGIISAQVRKVGGLLQLVSAAAQHRTTNGGDEDDDESSSMGELSFPIRLQTACSGTDAPSIALGLIKESLDKMSAASSEDNGDVDEGNSKKKGHLFEYTHEMSCEIEPFKQAYIGRNFPGVPLFPDITKLTASEEVVDVYGRPQRIPNGNLFVAGTSCKDFSMLKTSYRLDIEDKGTSGETFLAAVEFLEQEQPRVAIFENVDGAPWPKMQEYICGRIFLGSRNDTKAIKDANKKAGEHLLLLCVQPLPHYCVV